MKIATLIGVLAAAALIAVALSKLDSLRVSISAFTTGEGTTLINFLPAFIAILFVGGIVWFVLSAVRGR